METATVYVCGPLHPDLFDGETPIMRPVKMKGYVVGCDICCSHKIVVATDEDDAICIGRDDVELACEDNHERDSELYAEEMAYIDGDALRYRIAIEAARSSVTHIPGHYIRRAA